LKFFLVFSGGSSLKKNEWEEKNGRWKNKFQGFLRKKVYFGLFPISFQETHLTDEQV